jgi:hypothetical protein
MAEIARQYVRLVLAMGAHDEDYVDAYYGPPSLRLEAEGARLSLDAIGKTVGSLAQWLKGVPAAPRGESDELAHLRRQYLDRQLAALSARIRMLAGERMSFDEESKALYDVVAPSYPETHFQEVLDRLDARFPGPGSLVERYDAWRRPFLVPRDRLDTVFKTAIAACRERTLAHLALPDGEQFTVEYVTDKSWSGYNCIRGSIAA